MSEKSRDGICFRITVALVKLLAPTLTFFSAYLLGKMAGILFGYENAIRLGKIVLEEIQKKETARLLNGLEKEIKICEGLLSRIELSEEERIMLEAMRSKLRIAVDSIAENRESQLYDLHAAKLAAAEVLDFLNSQEE